MNEIVSVDILFPVMAIMCLLRLLFKNYEAPLIFVCLTLMHDYLFKNISYERYEWYFVTAALTDSITIYFIAQLRNVTSLGINLALVSLTSFALNGVCLLMWRAGRPMDILQIEFTGLYLVAIYLITTGDWKHARRHSSDSFPVCSL